VTGSADRVETVARVGGDVFVVVDVDERQLVGG
jgi:hypothetical protein